MALVRSQALTQGVAPTPGAASSAAAPPVEDNAYGFRSSASLLTLQDAGEEASASSDDEVRIVSVSGQPHNPLDCDLDGVGAPPAVPAQKDGKPLVVFKAPSAMKRPLSGVDNIRHGDLCVQIYEAFQVAGHPENCFQLCRPSNTDNIQLIRLLGAASREDPARDSAVMQKLLVWDHVCSVPTDVRSLTFALKSDFAINIVEDMVAARAFVDSGRSFEFYGNESETRNMIELENTGYVERATDSDGTASDSRWYLTRKIASLLEAFCLEGMLMLDDAAAEEGLKNADLIELVDEIPGTMNDEQLAEQFNAAVLAGHEIEMGEEAPSKRSRGATGPRRVLVGILMMIGDG
eukprot:s638_g29.t1